jgi:DHA1 family tetracycline resistance protein-like MFS transporter
MRKASLGTLFVTVFLDLLGFGLVVPFLPGVARAYGASNLEATLLGAAFSGMQFLFIPLWGRLSDRVGRRPVLLWSIAASAIGMGLLGLAGSLAMLFVARLWSGMATANIAVAQAYIADVTTPERRARGMGLIGMAFGLGFIFGPFIGGELGRFAVLGRPGALAAFVAAGLSAVNLVMALFFLPESRPAAHRGPAPRRRAAPLDLEAARLARATPGVPLAVAIGL